MYISGGSLPWTISLFPRRCKASLDQDKLRRQKPISCTAGLIDAVGESWLCLLYETNLQ